MFVCGGSFKAQLVPGDGDPIIPGSPRLLDALLTFCSADAGVLLVLALTVGSLIKGLVTCDKMTTYI